MASRRLGEEGSITVWVLATGAVLVLVAAALAMAGAGTVARHRAQSAADLAALGAASRVVEGGPAACERAADISARNGARLLSCRVDGFDVVVAVEVDAVLPVVIGTARASARAGPVESSAAETFVRLSSPPTDRGPM